MAEVGEGGDMTDNELSEQLLKEKPQSPKANFLAGYLKGGKDKVLQTVTSEHIEVTCRMTLAMFLSYIIAFFDVRWIAPIDQAPYTAIFVPFCAMAYPSLMFSFGLLVLPMFSVFLFVFISSTALLAIAQAGGTGWFIVAFAIWAFWICFLRWDKVQGAKTPLFLIGVVFQTFLIFPTFDTVQYGFTVPTLGGISGASQRSLLGYLSETTAKAVAMGAGAHDLVVESGVLKGRHVVITVNEDGTASNYVEGGMWLVTGRWTFSGVDNPLAAYQNAMIAVFWMMVFLSVIPLLPPFRTMRSAIWRGMIPGALMDAAALLRLHVDKVEKEGSLDADGSSLAEVKGKIGMMLGKCIYHMNALYEGNTAKLTFFEPRVFACKPAECTGGYLMHLSMLVTRVVSSSAGIALFTGRDFCFHNMDNYLSTAKNLESCAKALAIGNMSVLDGVDLNNEGQEHDSFTMHQRTTQIVHVSRKFLGAMTGQGDAPSFCSKEARGAALVNTKPWIDVHFSHYGYLAGLLIAPFRKSSWKALYNGESFTVIKFLWCVKYALGMAFLLLISIYWPAYRTGFSVDHDLKRVLSEQNGGWVMIAYCFATTQTAEGSIKKGILRMIGTVLGAFGGWLALLACEDASFRSGFNPYGLVAWMTVTSFIATYVSTGRGFLARVSLSSDFSFGPIYFVVTEIIILIGGWAFGVSARDAIVVNRLLANIVGILMAAFLALIPPGNYGGDPIHVKKINDFHWHSLRTVVERVGSLGGKSDADGKALSKDMRSLSADIVKTAANMLELTNDFHADAAKLQKLPFFSLDPMLKMEIGLVTRDNHVASFIPGLVATILDNDVTRPLLLEKNGSVQEKVNEILTNMENDGIIGDYVPEANLEFHLPSSELVDSRDDVDLLIRTLQWLIAEMRARDQALKKIEWGAFKGLRGPIKK